MLLCLMEIIAGVQGNEIFQHNGVSGKFCNVILMVSQGNDDHTGVSGKCYIVSILVSQGNDEIFQHNGVSKKLCNVILLVFREMMKYFSIMVYQRNYVMLCCWCLREMMCQHTGVSGKCYIVSIMVSQGNDGMLFLVYDVRM